MNVDAHNPRPTDRVAALNWDLEQSGHAWMVDQEIRHANVATLESPASFSVIVDVVYGWLFDWDIPAPRTAVDTLLRNKAQLLRNIVVGQG